MNCHNCGGLLAWTPGASVLNCGYCGSYRPLALADELADRVALLGTADGRICPACEQVLERAVLDETPAEACPRCHGLLLADEAFAIVVRQRRASYRGPEVTPPPVDPAKLAGQHLCPDCSRPMDRHCYGGGPGNQVIDACPRCGLVWLDSGELSALEASAGRRG
jgi:LSD1 subclass zinc finger protein